MEGFPQRYRIRWEVSLFLRLALAVATGSGSLAAQELPPAIQADRLLLRAEREIQTGREQEGPAGRRVYYYDAFLTLTEVLELQAEHDLDIPAVFFKYAQMALEVGECGWHGGPESAVPTRAKTARASVLRYLELTGRGGEHYRAALELLDEAGETGGWGPLCDGPGREAGGRGRGADGRAPRNRGGVSGLRGVSSDGGGAGGELHDGVAETRLTASRSALRLRWVCTR